MVGIDLAQPLAREERTGAVAQQALRTGSIVGLEHAIDLHAVEMHMRIEQGVEAVDEGNRADAGRRSRIVVTARIRNRPSAARGR